MSFTVKLFSRQVFFSLQEETREGTIQQYTITDGHQLLNPGS